MPEPYDDGGLSGASLERPALQLLLTEVRQGRVDVIVVYKVDRLTRSLADFAKLVETFDHHEVSFVSVTQSFNTTSSMGRLTLNVLLSFAQFEREMIGERVRDKIAASKRKGLWVGGPVPLGYRSIGKKLIVVEEEADQVRTIFCRYLALGSIGLLIDDLHRCAVKPRPRVGRDGGTINPTRFMAGPLAYLLKDRTLPKPMTSGQSPMGVSASRTSSFYAGSIKTHRPCVSDARQLSIPSARSRRMGATHFLMKTLHASPATWRCLSSPTISRAS